MQGAMASRSDLPELDEFKSHYEDRTDEITWARGTLPACGVFLAGAEYVLAPYGSRSARRLADAGAVLVASVTFDGARVPATTGGARGAGPVVPVRAREAARDAEPKPSRN